MSEDTNKIIVCEDGAIVDSTKLTNLLKEYWSLSDSEKVRFDLLANRKDLKTSWEKEKEGGV